MKTIFLFFFLMCILKTALAQECNCQKSFTFLVEKIEKNYAGFFDKVNQKTKTEYDHFTEVWLEKSKNIHQDQCINLMREWLSFFKDKHLGVFPKQVMNEYQKTIQSAAKSGPNFSIEVLDSSTLLLKLPNFEIEFKKTIENLIYSNYMKILSYPVLIIDVRGNGGGDDASFSSLWDILYSNSVEISGNDVRISEDNIRFISEGATKAGDKKLQKLAEKFKKSKKDFEVIFPNVMLTRPWGYLNPSRVYIIQNNQCGSSCEEFILISKQFNKVTTIGENTFGVLDYSNCVYIDFPDMKYVLKCPITRRLDKVSIDNIGIAPDIRISETEKDWVKYTLNYSKKDSNENLLLSKNIKISKCISGSVFKNILKFYQTSIYENKSTEKYAVITSLLLNIHELFNRLDKKDKHRFEKEMKELYYHLTKAYSVRCEIDSALHFFKLAISLGYDDYEAAIQDTDLNNLRCNPEFVKLIRIK